MTNPTITYGNAYANDCDSIASWSEGRGDMTDGNTTFTTDGDVFTLTGVTDELDKLEYFYEDFDLVPDIIDATYPALTVRWKTSVSAATKGLQAQIQIVYDDTHYSTHVLGYSTEWKVTTVYPTHGDSHTMAHVRLYAVEDAMDNPNGTYWVKYDWFIFHRGTFTFPHVGPGGISITYPMKIAQLPVPGRDGDVIQHLGQGSVTITLKGNVLEGETWRSASTYPEFDYFLTSILSDGWCYFTCDKPLVRCQVIYKNFTYGMDTTGSEANMTWQIDFVLHKLNPYSSFSDFSYQWNEA